jgi:ABC-type transporter Mla subunit MlaD
LTQNQEDAVGRASDHIARALNELNQAAAAEAGVSRDELARSRAALQELAQRLEAQLAQEKEQRAQLAGQLTNLAGSLDRLVSHLHGLSQLMAELLERLASPASPLAESGSATVVEPSFQPGGEGIALSLTSVPGFQALMDFQKALNAMEQVNSASVERFQEGDSRIQLQLNAPLTAEAIATALTNTTGHACVVEEARPELMRLRLKVVS